MFENEFVDKAKTGDLLIFRGFECPAKCQRFFTGSQYDHVALLFKRNGILFVYESTSKDGCMVRRWRDFTDFMWNLLYDKMVYRELIINMEEKQKLKYEEELIENCDLFIKETEKKKYTLSCCGGICCSKKKEFEKNNEWSKSDGFFCSQLVAAAYIKCNILKYYKGTGNFLPGNFAQDQRLELHDNFSLGPEIIVEFSK